MSIHPPADPLPRPPPLSCPTGRRDQQVPVGQLRTGQWRLLRTVVAGDGGPNPPGARGPLCAERCVVWDLCWLGLGLGCLCVYVCTYESTKPPCIRLVGRVWVYVCTYKSTRPPCIRSVVRSIELFLTPPGRSTACPRPPTIHHKQAPTPRTSRPAIIGSTAVDS